MYNMVPVQCVENPEGQNGCVIFDNRSYRVPHLDEYVDDHSHQNSETLRVPVQCIENPEGRNGCVIFENRSHRLPHGHRHSEHHGTQNYTSLRGSVHYQEDQNVLHGFINRCFSTIDMQIQ